MELTPKSLIDLLKQHVREAGSQKAAAYKLGVTDQYLSDVMRGFRPAGPKILTALKLEVVKVYRAREE